MGERIKITTRARNLGYGWRNDTEEVQDRHGERHTRVKRVALPTRTGGLLSVESEHALACQLNSGGVFWNKALFVGGRRITGLLPAGPTCTGPEDPNPGDFIRYLREEGSLWVEVE